MGSDDALLLLLRQQLEQPWFLALAILGAVYVAAVTLRLLSHLALLLRRPRDLRRRYGAWAVVTGPTSGIGRSVALDLARRGLNLVLVGRDPAKLHDISQTISATHAGAVNTVTVVLDLALVATPEGDAAMARLREAVAGLDVGVLVNNAGVAKPCAVYLHEADVEAWVRMVRVNLWALTEVTAAVLPGMVRRGRGAVVNIGSGSSEAVPSFPLYSVYAASKRSPGASTSSTGAKGSMCNVSLTLAEITEAARPPVPADDADVGRLRRRGGALDRARPGLHAQPGPQTPVVPLSRRAGPPPGRAASPGEPPAAGPLPAAQGGEDQRRPAGPQAKLVVVLVSCASRSLRCVCSSICVICVSLKF